MPVRKHRHVSGLGGPPLLPPLDPENLRLAFELMELGRRLAPLQLVPGVRKFRSFEEAVRARDARVEEQARRSRMARLAR